MSDVVIVDYCRTGVGYKDGSLSGIRSDSMIINCIKALVDRNPQFKDNVESLAKEYRIDSIVGCNSQIGTSALTVGRTAILAAHLPVEIPGCSLNRQCASGMSSIGMGIGEIKAGIFDFAFCGGMEQQTKYPISADLDWVDKNGVPQRNFPHPWISTNEYIRDPFDPSKQGVMSGQIIGAEQIGELFHAEREKLDQFSLCSHEKAAKFADLRHEEIAPIQVPYIGEIDGEPNQSVESKTGVRASAKNGKLALVLAENDNRMFEQCKGKLGLSGSFADNLKYFEFKVDEGVRMKGTPEAYAEMKPIKKHWVLTASNSCPESDGASAMLIARREAAEQLGLPIRAHIKYMTIVGSDAVLMLTGPQNATKCMMNRTGLTMDSFDIIEVNEAFSTVVDAFCKEVGIDYFDERINPWGGAIAIGHPTGSTGCRLIGTVMHQLEKKGAHDGRIGLATLCVGLGMGIAGVVELD